MNIRYSGGVRAAPCAAGGEDSAIGAADSLARWLGYLAMVTPAASPLACSYSGRRFERRAAGRDPEGEHKGLRAARLRL